MTPYTNFQKHKTLICIQVCAEYFTDYEDEKNNILPDFEEVTAIIEKDWLFDRMKKEGIKNLKNIWKKNIQVMTAFIGMKMR